MYSEEHEDPLYTKLSKILELTSLIFGHYKDTGQKERAHSLIVWVVSALQAVIENRQKLYIARPFTPETVRLSYMRQRQMPQAGIILYLRPLRPVSFILARRSFHKFYFILERKFAQITFHISILDPWLESGQIQKLLSHLLVKANRFILTIDGWLDEGLLDSWMGKDANRLWESVVRYVYKKRGLKFDIQGNESISR